MSNLLDLLVKANPVREMPDLTGDVWSTLACPSFDYLPLSAEDGYFDLGPDALKEGVRMSFEEWQKQSEDRSSLTLKTREVSDNKVPESERNSTRVLRVRVSV